jgi:hypothetical protein
MAATGGRCGSCTAKEAGAAPRAVEHDAAAVRGPLGQGGPQRLLPGLTGVQVHGGPAGDAVEQRGELGFGQQREAEGKVSDQQQVPGSREAGAAALETRRQARHVRAPAASWTQPSVSTRCASPGRWPGEQTMRMDSPICTPCTPARSPKMTRGARLLHPSKA